MIKIQKNQHYCELLQFKIMVYYFNIIVVSVTQSFRNHSKMLIYFHCWKQLLILYFIITLYFIFWNVISLRLCDYQLKTTALFKIDILKYTNIFIQQGCVKLIKVIVIVDSYCYKRFLKTVLFNFLLIKES